VNFKVIGPLVAELQLETRFTYANTYTKLLFV